MLPLRRDPQNVSSGSKYLVVADCKLPGEPSQASLELNVACDTFRNLLLHLVHRTLARALVGSPPEDRCAMAESSSGEVIVRNLDYVFRLHGLPQRRPTCRPSTRSARHISREALILSNFLKLHGDRCPVLFFDAG
jgi:hypothetical protein